MSDTPGNLSGAPFQKLNRLAAAIVFLATLTVYVLTVTPTVAFWDCGEFIATSYILGVPHPPGAPLYTLVGRIATMWASPESVALRVNMMSVLAGAFGSLLIYLSAADLLTFRRPPTSLTDRVAVITGGAVAALSVAFSTSFWTNATEAEVYAPSMCLTLLAFWLVLRWQRMAGDPGRDRVLLAIAYVFGLGAGVHLQCLLTLPGILVILYVALTERRSASLQTAATVALVLYPFAVVVLPTLGVAIVSLAVLTGMIVLRREWLNPWLWLAAAALMVLGFSTYLALMIRSGLDPAIDMNNPENWQNLLVLLKREQYGAHSVFPRRAEFWAYQMSIHLKYFLQQFPHSVLATTDTFRRAVTTLGVREEQVTYSLLPLLLGIGGAVYHAVRDWRRFAAVLTMFGAMGVCLVLYLNMPDPEPREREYIFVGAYAFFGIWMGMGAAGLVRASGTLSWRAAAPTVAALLAVVPLGVLASNYSSHDRSEDTIARAYARNILESCDEDALLFTNGDNDTYPLWYLQQVEGVRRDVRVVTLTLLKTPWFTRQIRDQAPTVPVNLDDDYLAERFQSWPWKQPMEIHIAGIRVKADDIPVTLHINDGSGNRIPVQEPNVWMTWRIVDKVGWERPIYFSRTVPEKNMAGLHPYLSIEGMVYRLTDHYQEGQFSPTRSRRLLEEDYDYAGIADPAVPKDGVTRRLVSNYFIAFLNLAQFHIDRGDYQAGFETLRQAEQAVPLKVLGSGQRDIQQIAGEYYRATAVGLAESGDIQLANASLSRMVHLYPGIAGRSEVETLVQGP